MPHIPIILDIEAQLDQLDQYHEQVSEALAEGEYDENQQQKTNAQALLADTESGLAAQKSALDAQVGAFEAFLGI